MYLQMASAKLRIPELPFLKETCCNVGAGAEAVLSAS